MQQSLYVNRPTTTSKQDATTSGLLTSSTSLAFSYKFPSVWNIFYDAFLLLLPYLYLQNTHIHNPRSVDLAHTLCDTHSQHTHHRELGFAHFSSFTAARFTSTLTKLTDNPQAHVNYCTLEVLVTVVLLFVSIYQKDGTTTGVCSFIHCACSMMLLMPVIACLLLLCWKC